jgi:enhancer of polycomb-like protein
MTARIASARFRQRKLSTKQNLPIVREHEVEQLADDDASRHIPKVETGVEKGEEIVGHAFPFSASPHRHASTCTSTRWSMS